MKENLYLDTSVLSAYYDEKKPERQELTREFWRKLKHYNVCISEVVTQELKDIKGKELRQSLLNLVKNFKRLKLLKEAKILAEEYVKNRIIPEKFRDDAYHIAIASANGLDYLVSWNFRHIVKVRTKRLVNLINLRTGYKAIEIIAPPEL